MIAGKTFANRRGEKLDSAYHEATREGVLVVLAHGVTGNKDRPLLVKLATELAARGWPCLRISYSGNGESGGDFRDATITKESEDLRDLLDQLPAGLKIAYIGHSMGGAVGLLTTPLDERIRVLVTLAGMVHTGEFVDREFGEVVPGEGFMWDDEDCPLSRKYVDDLESIGDLLDEASQLRVPYLLLHGDADDVVPPSDSEDAHAAARVKERDLVVFPGAGHSFEEIGAAELAAPVDAWLGRYL
ncbi:MAG: lysophospholipase [Akkermansiaceae bacterium]|jgi:pimeloyl-ACP methyl ester carboxylesterase|nr:lysophospholipase [Akkermansiaceae bacterium]